MSEEKYGIEECKKAVVGLGGVLGVAYDIIVNKAGVLKYIFSLPAIFAPLASMDFKKLKSEIGDLEEVEREAVEAAFKAALPAGLQSSVGAGVDLLEEGIDLAEDVVAFVKDGYAKVLAFVAKVKALVGA
jgi:hypothetical protein